MEQGLAFSASNRGHLIAKAKREDFDVVVIGGGITGAGIALDAASRGMSVCLVEKGDFASGTSGKSTKLIHGGLRYLKQFEFNLVKEVGRERAVLHRLAPHIVVPEKMVLPLIKGGSLGKTMTSIGLAIYDFLADVEGEDKRRMLDSKEVLEIEPLLPEEKLLGGSIYAEYRTDDARLTIEVMKTAYRHGALPLNYVVCQSILEKEGTAVGIQCLDTQTDELFEIKGRHIVNATGPWVDEVRSMSETIKGKRLYLTKGVHIVVPREKLPVNHAVYFDVTNDDRMIFAIPRLDVTYIGTTDTYYEGDKDDVAITNEDVEYLLAAINETFTMDRLVKKDIVSSWAGIRPLIYEDGKSASEISRKDEIFIAENGVLSIAGGKLTGYRKMSERIVDMIAQKWHVDKELKRCQTDEISLTREGFLTSEEVSAFHQLLKKDCTEMGLDFPYAPYLLQNYGKLSLDLLAAAKAKYGDLPEEEALVRAELDHVYENEMILQPLDFLIRRTGRLFFMPKTIKIVEKLIFQWFVDRGILSSDEIEASKKIWSTAVHDITTFD